MSGVLVTGASRGIGRAIATAFAARGDRLAVHYGSNVAAAEETLASLAGTGHLLVSGDLAEPEAVQRIADAAEEGLGGVDVLVNNAAVGTTPATATPVPEVSYADWQRVWRETLEVNLFGAANLSYCVARHLIARGAPGRIVNVGSRGAFRGEPDYPAYGAGKAALHSLGQSLAVALAPHGISVTSVAPGSPPPSGSPTGSPTRCAGRAPSAASPSRPRSPTPSSTWLRPGRRGRRARCSTSTAPPTCAEL